MVKKVDEIRKKFKDEFNKISSLKELEDLRIRYLGKKGEITNLLKKIKEVAPEDRKAFGQAVNTLKVEIQNLIKEAREKLEKKEKSRKFDLTLPGKPLIAGKKHPLIKVMEELVEIAVGLGFEIVDGPEIEWEYYNFEALNIPEYHPSRDMWSTLFITDKMLLRTHTSPVQIRTMENRKPPLKVFHPGRVYRKDPFDASHAPAFFQAEGLYVDKNVSFADLKATLEMFTRELFGPQTRIRFLPSYFPFTEPSTEVLVNWGEGWLEILGAGMVHPKVFEAVGYDPEEWTGYAFGLGPDRIAMIKYGIDDIRLFYENDLRFIKEL